MVIKKEHKEVTLLYPTTLQVINSKTEVHIGFLSFYEQLDVKSKT